MNAIFYLISTLSYLSIYSTNVDDQSLEILAARCYSKCLQIFIRFKAIVPDKISEQVNRSMVSHDGLSQSIFFDEMAQHLSISKLALLSCLSDQHNQCSRQCFKSCHTMADCNCQNDIGCLLACFFRKEMSKENNHDDCPSTSSVEESSLKISTSNCPKTCKSKMDCNINQQCCPTDTCGPICLQIDYVKVGLPKYTPKPTPSNIQSNIEFDWSETFSKHLKDESPLVFILQTRTCLCYKLANKHMTQWQTLVMTHRLGAKLNAFDNGTIYQFRLAAVTPKGTNGFGPISQQLPTVINKPYPPFPPEKLLEYKWKVTDDNLFTVDVKWDEPKPSFWRSYEYLFSWMVDHGMIQSEGEPMSSLTQYSKVLPGSIYHGTVDNLKPSTTYKIQIVTKAEWPGYGDLLSDPRVMYITTPATINTEQYSENFNSNPEQKRCICSKDKMDHRNIKIGPPIFSNGDLQLTIDMGNNADYLVRTHPEVCINYSTDENSNIQNENIKLYKQTNQIVLDNLMFNCRYTVSVTQISSVSHNDTYHFCFCTPSCYKSKRGRNCPNDVPGISALISPKNVKFSLLNYDTMTYTISWDDVNNKNRHWKSSIASGIVRYRILWAPRKFEPVPLDHYNSIIGLDPIFDWDRSDVRIVSSNITWLLLRNLTKAQLYIVRIQSLAVSDNGQLLESHPVAIILPTHGFSDNYYQSSQNRPSAKMTLILSVLKLAHCMIIRLLC